MEIWKDIPKYEGIYQISSIGRLKTLLSPIKLRHKNNMLSTNSQCCIRNGKGYKSVTLYKNGVGKQFMVHRLVAITFIPNTENKPQVNHKDADKHNNRIENLEWVTNSENKEHAVINGLSGKGEKNTMSKLTSFDVKSIRELYSKGVKPSTLSKKYGICKQHVHGIVKNKVWKHV